METKIFVENGKKVKKYLRICKSCPSKEWKVYTIDSARRNQCHKCSTDIIRNSLINPAKDELPQYTDEQCLDMIKKFEAEKKPSVTFKEETKRLRKNFEDEKQEVKEQIKKEEKILKEHLKKKVTITHREKKEVESKLEIKEDETVAQIYSLRGYERKFTKKKDGVVYYTEKLKEVFKDLGYKKKPTVKYVPSVTKVLLTGFEVFSFSIRDLERRLPIEFRRERCKTNQIIKKGAEILRGLERVAC